MSRGKEGRLFLEALEKFQTRMFELVRLMVILAKNWNMRNSLVNVMEPLFKFLHFMFDKVYGYKGDFTLGLTMKGSAASGTRAAAEASQPEVAKVHVIMLRLFKNFVFFLSQMRKGALVEHLKDKSFAD